MSKNTNAHKKQRITRLYYEGHEVLSADFTDSRRFCISQMADPAFLMLRHGNHGPPCFRLGYACCLHEVNDHALD